MKMIRSHLFIATILCAAAGFVVGFCMMGAHVEKTQLPFSAFGPENHMSRPQRANARATNEH